MAPDPRLVPQSPQAPKIEAFGEVASNIVTAFEADAFGTCAMSVSSDVEAFSLEVNPDEAPGAAAPNAFANATISSKVL